MIGLAWIPIQASAQLLPCIPGVTCPSPDNTPPTVSITSPASGAAVSGTISVTASASDDRGVAGVQFQLDGVDGGAEDTTTPYSVTWDTTTASDGSHTLAAVARDAAGNRTTSDPVTITVSNGTAPAAAKRYEDTDPSVHYGLGWNRRDDTLHNTGWYSWSGGSAAESMTPGAQATFTFTGTSVAWIGMRGIDSGIARVFLDGVFVSEVDMFARSTELHVPVFTASGLANSSHTLTIEATGLKNGDSQAFNTARALVVIDAFDVPAPVVSQLQDTDPDMSFTAGWTPGDNSKEWSGWFATTSATPGARATLPFIGTSISWLGYRGPDAGIANVYLDGSFAGEVDLYSPDQRVQAVLFTSPSLADVSHTLTIEATGRRNAASREARVAVDAFVVTTLGTRYEETDRSIAYTGNWTQGNFNRAWSMRTGAASNEPGAQATFTFNGTSVSWIGARKSTMGIARVLLDGAFVTEIDTYSATDGIQNTIFRASNLAAGTHTLTVEVTGRKNAAASNTYIGVDAFDARP
ncbi:MAG: Ig-like domain-containing protein [Burkholderiales bacterium]